MTDNGRYGGDHRKISWKDLHKVDRQDWRRQSTSRGCLHLQLCHSTTHLSAASNVTALRVYTCVFESHSTTNLRASSNVTALRTGVRLRTSQHYELTRVFERHSTTCYVQIRTSLHYALTHVLERDDTTDLRAPSTASTRVTATDCLYES